MAKMNNNPINKKKAIRDMRKGMPGRVAPDGKTETHKMGYVDIPNGQKKKYGVYPTIAPKQGMEKSTKYTDWKEQTAKEAEKRGEMVYVKSAKKAEKLAAGSWKQGQARKDAMKDYRSQKKNK